MQPNLRFAIILFITIASLNPVQAQLPSHLNAPAELQRILDLDEAARKSGDSAGRLNAALQLATLLNNSGPTILATAHAYSVLKDSTNTYAQLSQYAGLGFAGKNICNGADKKFTWLANSPKFKSICQLMQANEHAVDGATPIIHFPDTGYLAEDIDYDKTSHSFLFTSVLHHAIYRLNFNGQCRPFAVSPSGWPMMAIKIDRKRGLLWATEMTIPGFDGQPDTAKGRSAVCCYQLNSGKLKERVEAPEGAQWADMVLDKNGDPIISDGQSGAIFRLRQTTWQRLDKGDFISPQTPALTEDGNHLIIPDYERGLALMTIDDGAVAWIKNNPEHPSALTGVDGAYLQNHQLLLTQNGVDPERVQALRLDRSDKQITSFTLIEKATPTLGDPTHGVIVDGNFYYIANSGWDAVDQHGRLKPGSHMTQPTLMRYPLTNN